MQINLPSDAEGLIRQKSEAAGFGDDVAAYVAHLITTDRQPGAQNDEGENALEAFECLGLVGCIKDAPVDLATSPRHLEGLGEDDAQSRPH